MDAFSLRLCVEDVWQQLRCDKRRTLCCCVVALLGTVLGIVLYNVCNYNWWVVNRCDFVYKLVYGGFFGIFVDYLLCGAVVCSLLCCVSLWHWTQYLRYVVLFAISLYFGANCCAICACSGFLGVLYVILLLAVEQAINTLSCFLSPIACCTRKFKEVVCDFKIVFFLQIASILAKMFIIFALLRTITALI